MEILTTTTHLICWWRGIFVKGNTPWLLLGNIKCQCVNSSIIPLLHVSLQNGHIISAQIRAPNIFFREVNEKPTCLMCCKQLTKNKSSSIESPYTTAHPDYSGRYPLWAAPDVSWDFKAVTPSYWTTKYVSRWNNPTSTVNDCCKLSHCKHIGNSHCTIATW